jgi:hypothetical protein
MANDMPPLPQQSPIADKQGMVPAVWSKWFEKLIGFSEKSSNGYQKLPGGLMIQWGVTSSLNSATSTSISFPTTFANSCLIVLLTPKNNSGVATTATGQAGTGNYSTSAFDLYNRTSVAHVFNWLAVGY